ncbi:glucosamine inositolphosphorylceramide transferase family protein [Acidomonas methanolica]|uniref:glucosamine inositolphosphorylceramide transferase family protein n=1 Tax=Acidomonas methanolica TaxID=437 RepID=UPI00211A1C69|nr:hypothetical protein [Acidomonas methanolica]MCQ9155618.1 hypothetical protein [Acidomonas methanolica]
MAFLKTDLWRSVLVRAPIEAVMRAGSLDSFEMIVLPDPGRNRILADPFGVRHDGRAFVFLEAMSYDERHGVIDMIALSPDGYAMARHTVLREAWHLSYPFVFEHEGQLFMLPEACRSGQLSLYRSRRFPETWERVEAFRFPENAIDASPVFHEGRWWIFYTPAARKEGRQMTLCAAWADTLTGDWRPHPRNPIRVDRGGARPGGTPFLHDGHIVLPVQDCRRTYGAAVRFLHLHIDPDQVRIEDGPRVTAPLRLAPYTDGLHTISKLGDQTLIDVKRIAIGPGRFLLDAKRWLGARFTR